jgi:hypothetical protein
MAAGKGRGLQRHRRWLILAGVIGAVLASTASGVVGGALPRGSSGLQPANTCVVGFLPCYIDLSIDSGSHGNVETVTGAQFYPGDPYTVYFWNGSASAPATSVASGYVGYSGSFTASIDIPKDPVGAYTIYATDSAGDYASAPFHLTYLHASPDSGSVGSTIRLSGQGFLPAQNMTFELHGTNVPTTASCRTNANGYFSSCRVKVPNVGTGPTNLTATDGTYAATIEFDVK